MKAALDLIEDDAFDLFLGLERLLELDPALLAARLVARDHRFAERVFDALEIDFDLVADLQNLVAAGAGKFLECDTAFGLQTDVDDSHVLFDRDDNALDDRAFERVSLAEARIEHGGEIVARGRESR